MPLAPSLPVRTERLELRFLTPADAEAMAAYRSRPEVSRYVPFEPMDEVTVRERFADRWARRHLDAPGDGMFLGAQLRDGPLIGDVMLHWSDEHGCVEVGYVFHPDFGGHGYATEAVRAALGVAFAQLQFRRVTARVDLRNEASIALLRRLGMRQEAHLVQNEWFKGELTDELDFALLASEWTDRKDS